MPGKPDIMWVPESKLDALEASVLKETATGSILMIALVGTGLLALGMVIGHLMTK